MATRIDLGKIVPQKGVDYFDGQDGQDGTNGTNGTNGQDGVSPAVTIETIQGGHRVNITDAEHPQGQSFDVMDGVGGADEEDLTSVNNKFKLKDRTAGANGMGYKILRKNASFASQVTDTNTIYEIRYNFDLDGGTVTIPSGCTLKFEGGILSNGTIVGNLTSIISSNADNPIECSQLGTWRTTNIKEVFTEEDLRNAINNTSVSIIKIIGTIEMTSSLTIARSYTVIIGESFNTSKLHFQKSYDGIIIASPKCLISNLSVTNARVGIRVNNHSCFIKYCNIGQCYLGIAMKNAFISRILNCYIEQNYIGVYTTGESYESQIDKCRIDSNLGGIGMVCSGSNTPIISNCTIEGNRDNSGDKFGCGILLGGFLGMTSIKDNFFEKNGETTNSSDILFYFPTNTSFSDYQELISRINTIVSTYIPEDAATSYTDSQGNIVYRNRVREALVGTVEITNNRFSITAQSVVVSATKTMIRISDNYYYGSSAEIIETGLKPVVYYSVQSAVQASLYYDGWNYDQSNQNRLIDLTDMNGVGLFVYGEPTNVYIKGVNYNERYVPTSIINTRILPMSISNTKYSTGTDNYVYYGFKSKRGNVTTYHKMASSDYRYIELDGSILAPSAKKLFVFAFGQIQTRTANNSTIRNHQVNGWLILDLTPYVGGKVVALPNTALLYGFLADDLDKYNKIDYEINVSEMPENLINGNYRNVGETRLRPINIDLGSIYFDTTLNCPVWWNGSVWVNAIDVEQTLQIGTKIGEVSGVELFAPTSAGDTRPTLTNLNMGYQFFDTTLNKPIYWTGSKWVDATGADV